MIHDPIPLLSPSLFLAHVAEVSLLAGLPFSLYSLHAWVEKEYHVVHFAECPWVGLAPGPLVMASNSKS